MNPIVRYIARNIERLAARGEDDGESVWLFNPIGEGARRRYPWLPLSVRVVQVEVTPAIDMSSRGEIIYLLRGWFVARHHAGTANHYARYKEGDRIHRKPWHGIHITATSAARRQQTVYLGVIYGF